MVLAQLGVRAAAGGWRGWGGCKEFWKRGAGCAEGCRRSRYGGVFWVVEFVKYGSLGGLSCVV